MVLQSGVHKVLFVSMKKDADLFWAKVERRGLDDCWSWTMAHDRNGYGILAWGDRTRTAHSVAWEIVNGVEPPRRGEADYFELDHFECDNRGCCNPAHVRPSTHTQNMQRPYEDACANGHPWTPETELLLPSGARVCRPCYGITRPFKPAEHGSKAMYKAHGCRCTACRAWATDNGRKELARLAERIAANDPTVRHGTLRVYAAGCRCVECRSRKSRKVA